MVELTVGTVIRRHLDQLKLNMTNPVESESEPSTSADVSIPDCTLSPEVATPELRHSSQISRPPTHFLQMTINYMKRGGMLHIIIM